MVVAIAEKEKRDWLERYQDTHVIHQKTFWLGRQAKKCPMDAWMYQELIYSTFPDVIVETGTGQGGSSLFLASMCDLVGHGRVITIDIVEQEPLHHPRVKRILGDSINLSVVETVSIMSAGDRVMVILDSLHDYDHVLAEMRLYAPMIQHQGLYMVVEDSYLEPVQKAIQEFLSTDDRFVVDHSCEKFGLTFHPGGFLRCS